MHGEKDDEITHARKTRAMATQPKSGGAKMWTKEGGRRHIYGI
jgi:hypothetical protein